MHAWNIIRAQQLARVEPSCAVMQRGHKRKRCPWALHRHVMSAVAVSAADAVEGRA